MAILDCVRKKEFGSGVDFQHTIVGLKKSFIYEVQICIKLHNSGLILRELVSLNERCDKVFEKCKK